MVDLMKKGRAKIQQQRIYLFAALSSVSVWLFLINLDFAVTGGGGGGGAGIERESVAVGMETKEKASDPCGGKYIYVHDLPPTLNDDMLKDCNTLTSSTDMCKFAANAGLGPPLTEELGGVFLETGWYSTNQFAVYVIFSNRMKQYECLIMDSSLAAAVFVPFYATLWTHWRGVPCPGRLLTSRPEWGIMGGRDHFLVAGSAVWDFRRLFPAARNMLRLVVASSRWNSNDYGIPYPTYFHPANYDQVASWQDRMSWLSRKHLFCFAGAPLPGSAKSIWGQIIEQCKNSRACKLLGESKSHSPSSIMRLFQGSVFCLQPQGETYTRRSAFDAMLAGCIPVFFHPGSAYAKYSWHLPRNHSSYSVFIPEGDILKGVSIEERLREIPEERVKEMREAVIDMVPQLVYADPRSKLVTTFRNAFDVAVDAVIDGVTKLRRDMIEG